jgi:hypothetical protein
MGTPAFEKLQKRLNSSSIEQVLSLENQQMAACGDRATFCFEHLCLIRAH